MIQLTEAQHCRIGVLNCDLGHIYHVGFVIMFTVHLGEWTLTLGSSHVGGNMEYMLILFLISVYMVLRGNKAK